MGPTRTRVAVIGAGPVGLALALHAARMLPQAQLSLFDPRPPAAVDPGADARAIALALGSIQLLQRLDAWPAADAEPIVEVHVSQAPSLLSALAGEPEVRIRAIDEAVPLLGAVVGYGVLLARLEREWHALQAREPQRLHSRFGSAVTALKDLPDGVEVDAGIAEAFDLVVQAEGGLFGDQPGRVLRRDYRQTAWVGNIVLDRGRAGVAFERFTRDGPLALLPLRAAPDGRRRAALVWCVDAADDPVGRLGPAQRLALLNAMLPAQAGRAVELPPLKAFGLGLNAERTLVRGRRVCIGNAAQTLHPVAGQGLNLGLRDAHELVRALRDAADVPAALRRFALGRAADRWSVIAVTDLLARAFTWRGAGVAAARGLGLATLQAVSPARSLLARQMMFGRR